MAGVGPWSKEGDRDAVGTGCGEARSLGGSVDGVLVVFCVERSHLDGSIPEDDERGMFCGEVCSSRLGLT